MKPTVLSRRKLAATLIAGQGMRRKDEALARRMSKLLREFRSEGGNTVKTMAATLGMSEALYRRIERERPRGILIPAHHWARARFFRMLDLHKDPKAPVREECYELGAILREFRAAGDLSLDKSARQSGVGVASIKAIEAGRLERTSWDDFQTILGWIFGADEETILKFLASPPEK